MTHPGVYCLFICVKVILFSLIGLVLFVFFPLEYQVLELRKFLMFTSFRFSAWVECLRFLKQCCCYHKLLAAFGWPLRSFVSLLVELWSASWQKTSNIRFRIKLVSVSTSLALIPRVGIGSKTWMSMHAGSKIFSLVSRKS